MRRPAKVKKYWISDAHVRHAAKRLHCGFSKRRKAMLPLLLEQLDQRLLLSASLPGIDSVVPGPSWYRRHDKPTHESFDGQLILLDFCGQNDCSCDGPVTIEGIDYIRVFDSGPGTDWNLDHDIRPAKRALRLHQSRSCLAGNEAAGLRGAPAIAWRAKCQDNVTTTFSVNNTGDGELTSHSVCFLTQSAGPPDWIKGTHPDRVELVLLELSLLSTSELDSPVVDVDRNGTQAQKRVNDFPAPADSMRVVLKDLYHYGRFVFDALLSYPAAELSRHARGIAELGGLINGFKTAWAMIRDIVAEKGWIGPASTTMPSPFDYASSFAHWLGINIETVHTPELGAFLVQMQSQPTICASSSLSKRAQATCLMHEIAHWLLHHVGNSYYGYDTSELPDEDHAVFETQERIANAMASIWTWLFATMGANTNHQDDRSTPATGDGLSEASSRRFAACGHLESHSSPDGTDVAARSRTAPDIQLLVEKSIRSLVICIGESSWSWDEHKAYSPIDANRDHVIIGSVSKACNFQNSEPPVSSNFAHQAGYAKHGEHIALVTARRSRLISDDAPEQRLAHALLGYIRTWSAPNQEVTPGPIAALTEGPQWVSYEDIVQGGDRFRNMADLADQLLRPISPKNRPVYAMAALRAAELSEFVDEYAMLQAWLVSLSSRQPGALIDHWPQDDRDIEKIARLLGRTICSRRFQDEVFKVRKILQRLARCSYVKDKGAKMLSDSISEAPGLAELDSNEQVTNWIGQVRLARSLTDHVEAMPTDFGPNRLEFIRKALDCKRHHKQRDHDKFKHVQLQTGDGRADADPGSDYDAEQDTGVSTADDFANGPAKLVAMTEAALVARDIVGGLDATERRLYQLREGGKTFPQMVKIMNWSSTKTHDRYRKMINKVYRQFCAKMGMSPSDCPANPMRKRRRPSTKRKRPTPRPKRTED